MSKPCLVPGCSLFQTKHSAKNMCPKHYQKAFWSSRRKVWGGIREAKQFRRDFLVKEVSQLCELDIPTSRRVVDTIISSMSASLKRGEPVSVPGFGKLLIHRRFKRPKVYFVPSKQLVYLVKHPDYRKP